jgi:wyosine [tRNA(Phe)-imidazoG37] synthetase (radical SAM superfamily)
MATFLFDKIIFGPVKSRRLGASLGINLLPSNAKLCNFDCIYCECGRNDSNKPEKLFFHPRSTVSFHLYTRLKNMKENNEDLDVITFAGNGEPTLHPEFEGIIDDTIKLRNQFFPNVRIAVLSNATRIANEKIFNALNSIEDNILKLDSAFLETIALLNNPVGNFNLDKLIQNLQRFEGKCIIQTLFVQGTYNGINVDNSTEVEVSAWIELLQRIKPQKVMIYTIERDTPSPDLHKVPLERLLEIAKKVENAGFQTSVAG